jgi:hypothetical protein
MKYGEMVIVLKWNERKSKRFVKKTKVVKKAEREGESR